METRYYKKRQFDGVNNDSSQESIQSLSDASTQRSTVEDTRPSKKNKTYGPDFGVKPVPLEGQEVNIETLNNCLDKIINGQENDIIPPDVAAETAMKQADELNKQLMAIIDTKMQLQKQREKAREEAETEMMEEHEKEQIVTENLQMMMSINEAMVSSNGRLNRTQRIKLNNEIIRLINNTVTNTITAAQIQDELAIEKSPLLMEGMRGLFNALIQYYSEMASYGYNKTPEMLANMGSVVAGTAMIGSVLVTPQQFTGSGGILMFLSRYLGTATVTASGLYFIQRGGIPVTGYLETIGECVRNTCKTISQTVTGQLADIANNSLISLNNMLDEVLPESPSEVESSQSTGSSNYSTASSASSSIKEILEVQEPDQRLILLGDIPAYEELTQSSISDSQGEYGGRKRKSRRHMKSTKSIKRRKRRKGRMTKKGKKYHNTMKRYRSKIRQ
jgi:hypothetical protein